MIERCPKHGTVIVRPQDEEPFCVPCADGRPAGAVVDADLDFYAWPPRQVGGQQVRTSCGVLVVHRETGIAVVVDNGRSQLKNRSEAVTKLRGLLADGGDVVVEDLDGQRWRTPSGLTVVEVGRRVDGRGVKIATVRAETGAWHGWIHLSKLERV